MKFKKLFGFILIVVVGVQLAGVPLVEAFKKDYIYADTIQNTSDSVGSYPFQTHTVWSNRTKVWYSFYFDQNWNYGAGVGAFMYSAWDAFGNVIVDRYIIADSTTFNFLPIVDFDVAIDVDGDRVTLMYPLNIGGGTMETYHDPSEWRITYWATNEDTRGLDWLDSTIFGAIDPGALGSWDWKNPDVEYLQDNTLVMTMSSKISAGNYGGAVFWCDSQTNWDAVDGWVTTDDIMITEEAVNPPNTGTHSMAITPFKEQGFGIFWRDYEPANLWMKHQRLMICNDASLGLNLGSINGGRWRTEMRYNQYRIPDDALGEQYFDIVGYDDENLTVAWAREVSGNAYWYTTHYNFTSDIERTVTHNTYTGSANVVEYNALYINDRKNMAMVWLNDTAHEDPWIRRYNASSETWSSSTRLKDWNNPDIEDYSKSSSFASSWGDELSVAGHILEGSLEFGWFTIDGGEVKGTPSMENTTIFDSSGNVLVAGKSWLFEGEVYTLGFDTNNETESGLILFSDGNANMSINFNVSQNRAWFDNDNAEFKGSVIEHRRSGTYSWNVSFTLGEGIDDSIDVDFDYSVTNFDHNITITGSYIDDISIYNLGGFTMNRYKLNDAGWFPAGNPLEAWSQYNASTSWVNTSQVYRKLQHYHSQFSLDVSDNDVFDTKENTGDVEFHLQYYNGSGWYDVMYLAFDIPKGAVDPSGAGAGKAWFNVAWNWYGRNEAGNMASAKNGFLTAYPDCGDDVNSPVTTSQFWLDLWVDQTNNSRAVGGNFNPYYFGMDETGWLFYNNWRPLIVNSTFATVTIPLRDNTGAIMQADDMDLMRVTTVIVTGSASDTNIWSVVDFKNQDILRVDSSGRLRGIDKPALVETLVVDMPSTGFMSGLRKAIQNIGTVIGNALAGSWKSALGLIDTILAFLGLPEGFFSSIIFVLGEVMALFDALIQQFDSLVEYAVTSVSQSVLLVVTVAGRVVFFVIEFTTSLLTFWNELVDLFTGGWDNVGNLWQTLDILQWLQFWLVAIFPFWELDRLSESANPLQTAKDDVSAFWGMMTAIFRVFFFVWKLFKDIFDVILKVVAP